MSLIRNILFGIIAYNLINPLLQDVDEQEDHAEIGKLNTHRFIPVLKESDNDNKKYNLKHTIDKTGVYIIKENGKIVYVGYSGYNLYKTITRHFQEWNHPTQKVITYAGKTKKNKYTIRVVSTPIDKALKLEQALIMKYRPRDNDYVLNVIDLEAAEAKKVEKENKKALKDYNNADKFDYPPDWDNF